MVSDPIDARCVRDARVSPRTPAPKEQRCVALTAPAVGLPHRLSLLVQAVRVRQWPKQGLLLLAPLYAGAFTLGAALREAGGIAVFCLLSGAIYVVNDLGDRERDRLHPRKRLRPIASGALSVGGAWSLAVGCVSGAALVAGVLGWAFCAVAAAYAANSLLYTRTTKHIALMDVLALAMGFVLRAWAGAEAAHVSIGPWLLACAGSGAVLISLGKRRREIAEVDASAHRPALAGLDPGLFDQLTTLFATLTMVLYALACFDSSPARRGHALLLTLPVVAYGIMRYLLLCRAGSLADEPERMVMEDAPLRWTVAAWAIVTGLVMMAGQR